MIAQVPVRIGRFLHWSKVKQRQFLLILVVLSLTKVGLRLLGFKRWYALLVWFATRVMWRMPDKGEHAQAQYLLLLLRSVTKYSPVRSNCLSQSLTLWWLLHCYGLQGDLRIGVRYREREFRAHAWIEFKGVPLNDSHRVGEIYATFENTIMSKVTSSMFAKLEQ
jgi:hypothetical protein